MALVDRYLAREILVPFAAAVVFLTQLLIATQLLADAEVLFGSGVSALDLGAVVAALLPHLLGFILPIAFLPGAAVGVRRLAEDREVVALSAAGVSPARLVRVPLALAGVTAAASSRAPTVPAITTRRRRTAQPTAARSRAYSGVA